MTKKIDEKKLEEVEDKNIIEELENVNEADEWKNKYLRALADYHNLENRVANQIEIQNKANKKRLLSQFLEILDNIERAEIFVTDPGLQIVIADFHKMLEREGVVEMDLFDKPYDPTSSECVEVVAGDDDNMVAEVVQKGYMLHDSILREAKVKVTKKL